jgi:hypothetical protein
MLPHWVSPFLDELTASGNVSGSARAVGISTTAVYALKYRDADFAAAWAQALEDSADILEAEARRRAVQGVQEPVVYQGQLTPVWKRDENGQVVTEVYDEQGNTRPVQEVDANGRPVWLTVTKHSDSLLALLLKGRRKNVFADRTELTGADGGPVVMDKVKRGARLAYLLDQAARRKGQADDFSDIA